MEEDRSKSERRNIIKKRKKRPGKGKEDEGKMTGGGRSRSDVGRGQQKEDEGGIKEM